MKRKAATTSLRAIGHAVVAGSAVGLLASGSCVFHVHHCFDRDGDGRCDPPPPQPTATASSDDPWRDLAPTAAGSLRIERYTLFLGIDGDLRETRRIEAIRGVSMLPISPGRSDPAPSVRAFAESVLDVNQDLIGIDTGRRSFEGVHAIAAGLRLDYAVGAEGVVHLFLDGAGGLVAVASRASP